MKITQETMQRLESLSTQVTEQAGGMLDRVVLDEDSRKLARLVSQLGRITKLQTQLLRRMV